MMPKMCDGSSRSNGKKNPVTLVRIVVTRNTAVQPGSRCARSIPARTTSPVTMPIRLMTTCTSVKVASDMPRIMVKLPVVGRGRSVAARFAGKCARLSGRGLLLERAVNELHRGGAFADCRRHAFDAAGAHVADREDAGSVRLQK